MKIDLYVLCVPVDSGHHQPGGTEEVLRGSVPERLWKDQPGHDEAVAAGLEGGVCRRRHRLDEV